MCSAAGSSGKNSMRKENPNWWVKWVASHCMFIGSNELDQYCFRFAWKAREVFNDLFSGSPSSDDTEDPSPDCTKQWRDNCNVYPL